MTSTEDPRILALQERLAQARSEENRLLRVHDQTHPAVWDRALKQAQEVRAQIQLDLEALRVELAQEQLDR